MPLVLPFLAAQGIPLLTWMQFLSPAQHAWQRQCEVIRALRANLDDWMHDSTPGIQVLPREHR